MKSFLILVVVSCSRAGLRGPVSKGVAGSNPARCANASGALRVEAPALPSRSN